MSLAQVRLALADPQAHLEGSPVEDCAYLASKRIPTHLNFMFLAGKVTRIETDNPGVRTASGIGVGDSEEKVKHSYPGQIAVERAFYDENGHFLNYSPKDPSDANFGIVFETDGHKVTSFRAGTKEAVALVEGCS